MITESPGFFPFDKASAIDLKETSDNVLVPDIAVEFVELIA
jgi:hypothetical protein